MASRRDSLRAHKRPRALRQKDAGTLCSVVCSPAIRSDPLQESSLKESRKKDSLHGGVYMMKITYSIVKPVDRPTMNSIVKGSRDCGAGGLISTEKAVNFARIRVDPVTSGLSLTSRTQNLQTSGEGYCFLLPAPYLHANLLPTQQRARAYLLSISQSN